MPDVSDLLLPNQPREAVSKSAVKEGQGSAQPSRITTVGLYRYPGVPKTSRPHSIPR